MIVEMIDYQASSPIVSAQQMFKRLTQNTRTHTHTPKILYRVFKLS